MNINRREFLKIGLAVAAVTVAPTALAIEDKPSKHFVSYDFDNVAEGEYELSFYYKCAGDKNWRREVRKLLVSEDMKLAVRVDFHKGDSISMMQVERIYPTPPPYLQGSRTNILTNNPVMRTYSNANAIPDQHAPVPGEIVISGV
jgi:hypothetical protein